MRKQWVYLALIPIVTNLSACRKDVQRFSQNKPLALEVTRVRSYYHAQDIKERLVEKGLQPYVVASHDSAQGGKWYAILVGAKADSVEIGMFSEELVRNHDLDSLNVVHFQKISGDLARVEENQIKEMKQIDAEEPDVPTAVLDIIRKFPKSNMFFVDKLFAISTPDSGQKRQMFSSAEKLRLDLPRGISTGLLLGLTEAFAEAIYTDNIYGDRVTVDILKLKSEGNWQQRSPETISLGSAAGRSSSVAGYFADLVLDTGEYATEEKLATSAQSFRNLNGYKVVIEPKPDYFRTYLILVDELTEYAVFCQSTEKTGEELNEILQLAGKSSGMLEYDEFYNTFFTLPSNLLEGDVFVAFYISKLGWAYAKEKDYADWSKEYVGHWAAHGYFYNLAKGPWSYGIFDLLTEKKVNFAQRLYSKETSNNKQPVKVYGTDGFFITRQRLDIDNLLIFKKPWEVNFPMGRYVCMVDNIGSTALSKDELVAKAEAFQFQKGGYRSVKKVESETDYVTK